MVFKLPKHEEKEIIPPEETAGLAYSSELPLTHKENVFHSQAGPVAAEGDDQKLTEKENEKINAVLEILKLKKKYTPDQLQKAKELLLNDSTTRQQAFSILEKKEQRKADQPMESSSTLAPVEDIKPIELPEETKSEILPASEPTILEQPPETPKNSTDLIPDKILTSKKPNVFTKIKTVFGKLFSAKESTETDDLIIEEPESAGEFLVMPTNLDKKNDQEKTLANTETTSPKNYTDIIIEPNEPSKSPAEVSTTIDQEPEKPKTPEELWQEMLDLVTSENSKNPTPLFVNKNKYEPEDKLKNKNIFEKIPAIAESFSDKVHKTIKNIIPENRLIEEMKLTYNDLWGDFYKTKNEKLKNEINKIDQQLFRLAQAETKIMSYVEKTDQNNLSMTGVIVRDDIGRQKHQLQEQKNTLQKKLDFQKNKAEIFTAKRDNLAEELFDYYDAKIKPLEKEVKKLQKVSEINSEFFVILEKNNALLAKLEKLEQEKTQLKNDLGETGMTSKKIKELEDVLYACYKCLKQKKDDPIIERKNNLDKKILKANVKLTLYKDKKQQLQEILKKRNEIKLIKEKSKRVDSIASHILDYYDFLKKNNYPENFIDNFLNTMDDFLEEVELTRDHKIGKEAFNELLNLYARNKQQAIAYNKKLQINAENLKTQASKYKL